MPCLLHKCKLAPYIATIQLALVFAPEPLNACLSHPRRLVAGHCLIIMANTTMGFGELRHVRRKFVFLDNVPPFVEVNDGTKNDFRIRSIPLNRLALRSMRWIVKRWEGLGGSAPDEFILPHSARNPNGRQPQPIFTEPMGKIYHAANEIFKEAKLEHLTIYDMRSHAITKLLSDPDVSDQVYSEIAGHVGQAVKRRYSKQRMENKGAAIDALCERQVQTEIATSRQQAEENVRASLGMPSLDDELRIERLVNQRLAKTLEAFQNTSTRSVVPSGEGDVFYARQADSMCAQQRYGELTAAESEASPSTSLSPAADAAINAPAATVDIRPQVSPDLMDPVIQAHIALQVAQQAALQLSRVPPPIATLPEPVVSQRQTQSGLITFPGPQKRA
jgi:hypothetical protein